MIERREEEKLSDRSRERGSEGDDDDGGPLKMERRRDRQGHLVPRKKETLKKNQEGMALCVL